MICVYCLLTVCLQLGLYQVPVGFAVSLSITNCTRLLLNIRRAYYPGVSDPVLYSLRRTPTADSPPSSRYRSPRRPTRPPPLVLYDTAVPLSPLSPQTPTTPITPLTPVTP